MSFYAESCVDYLFGPNGIIPYKVLFIVILLIAPITSLDIVWTMSDIFNAFMTLPNIFAMVVLAPVITKETNYYLYGNRLDEYDKTPVPFVKRRK